MVAFYSTRRRPFPTAAASVEELETYPQTPLAQPPEPPVTHASSRRDDSRVVVQRSAAGEVELVRIGRWRTIAASPRRTIAEVREVADGRIALRFDVRSAVGGVVSSVVWQVFDRRGRLTAALQLTRDGRNALLTNYETRRICRLVRDRLGELRPVENWRM